MLPQVDAPPRALALVQQVAASLAGWPSAALSQRATALALVDLCTLVAGRDEVDLDDWADRVPELLWGASPHGARDAVTDEAVALAASGRAAGALSPRGTAALRPARWAAPGAGPRSRSPCVRCPPPRSSRARRWSMSSGSTGG